MKIYLKNGKVWQNDHTFAQDCPILLEDDRILSVGEKPEETPDLTYDLCGRTVIPGLVDVHTHGRAGYDFCTATEEQMRLMKDSYVQSGVTSLFATLASAPLPDWYRALQAIETVGFDGVHLEGRYLNVKKRGAHNPNLLVPLNASELECLLSAISLPCHVTAAYELDADGSFAATAKRLGATLGLGHTNATAEEAKIAVHRGVTSFTHLFNAMPPLHHRDGGAVSVALNGDGYGELICDGLHICPDMIKLAYRCLGTDKTVLITDSMEATGCADGDYSIAGQPVKVVNGKALTEDGALAGSTLSLIDGVKNLIRFADAKPGDAVAAATVNPARMVGIDRTVGSIEAGKRADLLVLDDNWNILEVIFGGKPQKGALQ